MVTKRASQRRRKGGGVSVGAHHHFFWFACRCTESGSLPGTDKRGTWCKDAAAVRLLKANWYKRCAALVQAEADVIGSSEETSTFYSPYTYEFVHLAFPERKFPTKQAAAKFMAQAFKSDDADAIVGRFLKDSVVQVFDITKDEETCETDVTVTEGESDEALSDFLDYHSG
jgi:hypothetical protein